MRNYDPLIQGATPQRVMERAYALCPLALPHLKKMAWIADYYERNRAQPNSVEPVQWRGLTEKEVLAAVADADDVGVQSAIRAVEAKLRRTNGFN